jgi:Dyp-type peroxidase family
VLVAAGFTYHGLQRLVPGAHDIESIAFKQGLAVRSAFLGDPEGAAHPGDPRNWVVGAAGQELDALIVVADDSRKAVDAVAYEFEYALCALGVVVHVEVGDASATPQKHEHFGFNDGISQPGIRGRASRRKDDFITPRKVPPSQHPETWLQGRPGQDLIWPGELVFGYPAAGADPLVPGRIAKGGPDWMHNGSFLVFRRLRQDVGAFWTTMRDEAGRLSGVPDFGPIDATRLAAMLIGRWPDGTPVMRSPRKPWPGVARAREANNNFLYDTAVHGPSKGHPGGVADPLGRVCPWASHIRKVNPRDASTDMGGAADTLSRRILRVGIPYGDFLPARARLDPAHKGHQVDRGLLFMSIQSSIENQFEFLQSRWMNDTMRPKGPGGHDMIVGQNGTAGQHRARHCAVFGNGPVPATVEARTDFVTPTGGGYFFLPSLTMLAKIIGTPRKAPRRPAK